MQKSFIGNALHHQTDFVVMRINEHAGRVLFSATADKNMVSDRVVFVFVEIRCEESRQRFSVIVFKSNDGHCL